MVEPPFAVIEVSSREAYIEIKMAIEARARMLEDLVAAGPSWPNGEVLLRHATQAKADVASSAADRV